MTAIAESDATLLDALVRAIAAASGYNRQDQAPPAAVLWPDRERQWEPLLPQLRERLPLLTLGAYTPGERTGPAYWLRCAIGGTLPAPVLLPGETPVIYLQGYGRQDLRAVEDCPRELQPLAELQYRGAVWSHRNGKDWTIAAFLQSDDGLVIEVAPDSHTREALSRALLKLADEPLARLRREAPLQAAFLNELLNPDPVRGVLRWLNDPIACRAAQSHDEWTAFRGLCRQQLGLNPETDGELSAALKLGNREGRWETVWRRFAESPASYPGVAEQLRRARPTRAQSMLAPSESWPQENEAAEEALRNALRALESETPAAIRAALALLEAQHGHRRGWVWAQLGKAPLAGALQEFMALARETERVPSGDTPAAIASAYAEWGWHADASAVAALAAVEGTADAKAVEAAVRALYGPWLDQVARGFQDAVARVGPAGYVSRPIEPPAPGTCLLFSDGLRYDVAQLLAVALAARGSACEVSWRLTALPSVTSTAKQAVSPVANQFIAGAGLDPATSAGTPVNIKVLQRTLIDAGYQVLEGDATGDPAGRAWTEHGDIDSLGHNRGALLAYELEREVRSLAGRITALLDAGWSRVVVVTDHGWLLLPGGLPKTALPEHLTDVRKGRCARLRPKSETAEQTVPWFWDAAVQIAVARGMACYEAGKDYEHGGLSPQECVTPVITVMREQPNAAEGATIAAVTWRGLRCGVTIAGPVAGLLADLRSRPGDAASSLAGGAKRFRDDGTVSLLVADEERAGEAAAIVVLDAAGRVLAQTLTTTGG
ncbi:MAG: BREX-1 system phosphatase PglZ type B [Dehalococcoidia bacterium]